MNYAIILVVLSPSSTVYLSLYRNYHFFTKYTESDYVHQYMTNEWVNGLLLM